MAPTYFRLEFRVRDSITRLRCRCYAILGACVVGFVSLGWNASWAGSPRPSIPAWLQGIESFRGRILYNIHADGIDPHDAIAGVLVVDANGWSLEERSARVRVGASSGAVSIERDRQTTVFDDPFEVNDLANAWTALLGEIATHGVKPAGGATFDASRGLRVYVSPDASQIAGAVDARSNDQVSFVFNDWIVLNGMPLPQTILRMRNGANDESFTVDSYSVDWIKPGNSDAGKIIVDASRQLRDDVSGETAAPSPVVPLGRHLLFIIFGLFLAGFVIVAWMRRDALLQRVCARLARDPRAWRDVGTTVLVSPEGHLWFENRIYRVGVRFYNRRTLVQSSTFFLRVSAPPTPHVTVLAKRFGMESFVRQPRHVADRAFTLVETLAATALFTTVVVAVMFPLMIVLAQADRIAQERMQALQIAANTLVDEQAALEYGSNIQSNTQVSQVNGFTVTVDVSASSATNAHDVAVHVADSNGHVFASVATMVGPPVPAPAASPGP